MKKSKKILSALLILAILLPSILTVSASRTNMPLSQSERVLLIDALSEIEPQKDAWGLANVDFTNLNVGLPIQTYNYVEGTLESSHVMYPLTVDDRLVLWAIPIGGQFQITNGLASEVNTAIDFNTPLALIYDASNAYIYSDQYFSHLKHFDQEIDSRGVLNTNTRLTVEGINTISLSQKAFLGYEKTNNDMHRAIPMNYSCNVSYVTQHPYNNLCWAASVACIVNHVNGTSLDAVTVAKRYFGNTDFNRDIGEDNLTEKIQGYGLSYYQACTGGNFDNKIIDSILADNPVGAVFDVINGPYHAGVIYSINVISGRIQVMDPEFGMTTASLSETNDYVYVSSYSNATLELYAISHDPGV